MPDRFDIKLLALVQGNNRLTAAELAERVGLSPSACHRRLQKLRADGVIVGDAAIIAPEAIGRHIMMIVNVTLEREQSDVIRTFKQAMRDEPEVMQCYYVTGATDFVIVLTARSMEDYDRWVDRFLFSNRNVRRFETLVVMDRVKVGFNLPIGPPDE